MLASTILFALMDRLVAKGILTEDERKDVFGQAYKAVKNDSRHAVQPVAKALAKLANL